MKINEGNDQGADSKNTSGGQRRGGRSNKGRLYVGGTGLYGAGNLLEGDPQGYRGMLERVDELMSTAKGRSGRVSTLRREPRCAPQSCLAPWTEGTFSLVYYFEADQKRAKWQEMWRFLSSIPHVVSQNSASESNPKLVYDNQDTGVQAQFQGYCPQHPNEVGVEFSVQLPQPQCVAHEVLPVALRLLREFHVAVRLRTAEGVSELSGTKEALLAVWLELVNDERRRMREAGETFFPVRSAAVDSVWEFQLLREELKYANRHNECILLPVEYVFRKRTKEVLRLCRWPELLPAVFPPVDLIMLVDPPAPIGNGRIVEAAEVFAKGKEWIKTEPFPLTHKLYTRGQADAGFVTMLSKLKGATMRSYTSVDWHRLDDR